MNIILSKQCESLTGTLGRGYGYCIESRRTKKGSLYHYAKRNSKGPVPPSGHWRFIVLCAQLAQNRLHIADIAVQGLEICQALQEAGFDTDHFNGNVSTFYNAREVLGFARQFKIESL